MFPVSLTLYSFSIAASARYASGGWYLDPTWHVRIRSGRVARLAVTSVAYASFCAKLYVAALAEGRVNAGKMREKPHTLVIFTCE